MTIVHKAIRKALAVLDKSEEDSASVTLDKSAKITVATNRRYMVTELKELRAIVRNHIGGTIAPDDWEFGLGEVDAPSLKLKSSDPIPSEPMRRNHQ